jgi:hypothetical protein
MRGKIAAEEEFMLAPRPKTENSGISLCEEGFIDTARTFVLTTTGICKIFSNRYLPVDVPIQFS